MQVDIQTDEFLYPAYRHTPANHRLSIQWMDSKNGADEGLP